MKLVLVRHGVTLGNAEGRLQGHADYSLSEKGRSQARSLRNRFKAEDFRPTHIYTSPLLRAAETASIVGSLWPIAIEPWDDLKEQNGGVFGGLTWDEIAAQFPKLYPAPGELIDWESVDGAESDSLASGRAARVIHAVITGHTNDDTVLIFAHGGIIQHMVAWLLGTDRFWGIGVHNTAIFEFTIDQTRWFGQGTERKNNLIWWIDRFNDASHLGRSAAPKGPGAP